MTARAARAPRDGEPEVDRADNVPAGANADGRGGKTLAPRDTEPSANRSSRSATAATAKVTVPFGGPTNDAGDAGNATNQLAGASDPAAPPHLTEAYIMEKGQRRTCRPVVRR